LNNDISLATKARAKVENARLSLDATKAKAKPGVGWALPVGKKDNISEHETPQMSEAARVEIEHAEDDFVAQTEDAVGVMKNVSLES
jgi:hypothetical protein